MKITLAYFSGTGNTRFVSGKILEKLSRLERVETDLIPVEQALREGLPVESGAILGIGFPVYDLMPPDIVLEFAQSLPAALPGQLAFVFSTYTSYPLDANRYVIEILQDKGYRVIMECSFKAPGAVAYVYANPELPVIRGEAVFGRDTDSRIESCAREILSGVRDLPPELRIRPHPLRKFHQAFSRFVMGNLFYRNLKVSADCTGCGLCAAQCPSSNLTLTDGTLCVKQSNECLRCMRCVVLCPSRAINFTSARRRGDYTHATIEALYQKGI